MAKELTFNNGAVPSPIPTSGKAAIYSNTDKYFHTLNEAGYDHIQLSSFFTSNQSGDFTMANSANAQSPFAAANDVVTLPASTTYFMEGFVVITGMGGTTRTTALEFDAGEYSTKQRRGIRNWCSQHDLYRCSDWHNGHSCYCCGS